MFILTLEYFKLPTQQLSSTELESENLITIAQTVSETSTSLSSTLLLLSTKGSCVPAQSDMFLIYYNNRQGAKSEKAKT